MTTIIKPWLKSNSVRAKIIRPSLKSNLAMAKNEFINDFDTDIRVILTAHCCLS